MTRVVPIVRAVGGGRAPSVPAAAGWHAGVAPAQRTSQAMATLSTTSDISAAAAAAAGGAVAAPLLRVCTGGSWLQEQQTPGERRAAAAGEQQQQAAVRLAMGYQHHGSESPSLACPPEGALGARSPGAARGSDGWPALLTLASSGARRVPQITRIAAAALH